MKTRFCSPYSVVSVYIRLRYLQFDILCFVRESNAALLFYVLVASAWRIERLFHSFAMWWITWQIILQVSWLLLQTPFHSTHTVAYYMTGASDPTFLLPTPWLTPSVPQSWMEPPAYRKQNSFCVEETISPALRRLAFRSGPLVIRPDVGFVATFKVWV